MSGPSPSDHERYRYLKLKQAQAAAGGQQSDPASSLPPEDPSGWESAGRGALQGLTAGFGDEIYGAYKGLTEDGNYGDIYKRERDSVRANNARAQQANPISYGAGQVGGGLATALIPGAAPASLGGAIAFGAGSGALNAIGDSESDDIRDIGKEALIGGSGGAVMGGVGYGAGKLIGAGINRLKGGMDKGANALIAKHTLSPSDFGSAVSDGEVQKMGQAVFDEGLTGPLTGRAEIGRRAAGTLDEGLSAQKGILKSLPSADVGVLRDRVQNKIVDPAIMGGRGHSVAPVEKLLESIDGIPASGVGSGGTSSMRGQNGPRMMDGEALNDLKQNWQSAFRNSSDKPSSSALRSAAHEARVFEEEHVGNHAAGSLPEFMEAKGKVMIGGKVKDGMEEYASSPHNELLKGGAAAAMGGLALGPKGMAAAVGGSVAKHFADGRETTLLAHTMKALGQKDISMFRSAVSKALTRNPFFLGRAGHKLAAAMAEDSSDPAKNTTAKVSWEQSSDPQLQQYLKDEREQ